MNVTGEHDRRLANVVRVGTVAALDEPNARVKIDLGDLITDWLPWATTRAGGDRSWSAHEVGEQVLLFAPSGELAAAVVMGAINQDAHPAPAVSKDHTRYQWADGAFVDYDRTGHLFQLDVPVGGSILLRIGQTTLKLEDGKTTLTTPHLDVVAAQTVLTGGLTVAGQTALAGVTSNGHDIGSTHKHTGVSAGAAVSGSPQ